MRRKIDINEKTAFEIWKSVMIPIETEWSFVDSCRYTRQVVKSYRFEAILVGTVVKHDGRSFGLLFNKHRSYFGLAFSYKWCLLAIIEVKIVHIASYIAVLFESLCKLC